MNSTYATANPHHVQLRQQLTRLHGESATLDDTGAVQQLVTRALRAVSQFESGMEVIVCIGMLKAGKSTLVNLLTRSANASPMGYGQDTTLRPALIRMAAPGAEARILIFDAPGGLSEAERAGEVRRVMDYLRGIGSGDGAGVRVLPLSDDVLTRVLCSVPGVYGELPSEPLMVVVETPYCDDCVLLRDRKRMILDMPGCDSPHAAVVRSGLYRELGNECDMALILQSTVAPLNEKAVELLRELLGARSVSTIRLIQNRMEAKVWLRAEELAAENALQQRNARRVFSLLAGDKTLHIDSVNLGLAYAGIFESPARLQLPVHLPAGSYGTQAELLAASDFAAVEQELNRSLPGIRYAHCRDELLYTLRELQRTLTELQANVQQRSRALEEARGRWREFGEQAFAVLQPAPMPGTAVLSLAPRTELPDFEALVARTCHSWKDGRLSREEVTGEDVNKCLDACNRACREAGLAFLQGDLKLSQLQVRMPGGGEVQPLDRYCDDVLIRQSLREGINSLDERYPELLRSFAAAVRPEHRQSVCDCTVQLPLKGKDCAGLECHYERMPESSQVPGRFYGMNTVKETYRNVLHYEPFKKRLAEIAAYYRSAMHEVVSRHLPVAGINKVVQSAATLATGDFHAALRENLRRNRMQLDSLAEHAQRLVEFAQRVEKLKTEYENHS